eukprot:TRINITY_DN1745_c0_g1_i1.p1 TRINITY_DN1745_c0_g1~~TRINITY_DN1745_c0_g1_i1.p1  ORF type:complete len:267 (-),score=54.80 TRINITY_DN1745_c0_g1_i1:915-1715(-)
MTQMFREQQMCYTIWYNIPADTVEIPINAVPDGVLFGVNTQGLMEYHPPTPPPNDPAHRYRFTLSAVAAPIVIDQADATKENILMAAFSVGIIQQVRIHAFWGVPPDTPDVPPISGSGMVITSSAFANFDNIPIEFTALDGEDNVNPPIHIAGIPSDAQSLAIIVSDPTAPGMTVFHWIILIFQQMAKILLTSIQELYQMVLLRDRMYSEIMHTESLHQPSAHEYHFEVFALDVATLPGLSDGADIADVQDAIEQHNVICTHNFHF